MAIPFRFKLIGSFVLVVLAALLAIYLFSNYSTSREFRLYVIRGEAQRLQDLKNLLIDYYKENGSWAEVWDYLARLRVPAGEPLLMRRLVLLGPEGEILVAPEPRLIGQRLPQQLVREALPIDVGGQKVGLLLAGPVGERLLEPLEQNFLSSVNRSLLLGGLVALGIALALGLLLLRQLITPLKELTAATEGIASGDLERRVRVRSRDELGRLGEAFNKMADSLKRSEELRRRMIADVAHELRTPLTVIRGQLEALRDGVFSPTPEKLEELDEEALLLDRLVDDLHELALAEAGELRLERGPTDLGRLITRLGARIQGRLAEQGIELGLELPEGLPKLNLDSDRIEQVLHNLLSNAERYTPQGGRITVAVEDRPQEVLISVSDTGKGIPAEELPRIFERFYRGEQSRSRRSGGAGLGLAIAKQLVEAHGGRIWAESEPGRGTKVSFTLPKG
ncbi:MAG: ATP-binding protein [Candidatus Acetothermia bacterium]|jgi:signal transduction histidine kinase|nr:ATP-binding protein [Candidatus Acetothermia bacterium]MDH7505505.1 ATP-binding protein [Candidatus Acetothermia bacterium]